ncbi:hypothetical protein MNBD_GAMMA03-36 [hydrothermal vent metagenome]|uniref:DUF945 domain-containing protein n=1 Tax=hydrothermal vent metagenome TaxID=652676 RepID=A0A3B0WQ91_9ZZZZ
MKQAILLFTLLVPATWAGVTWYSSNKTEFMFDNILTQSEYASDMITSNQKTSFEKGFFKSTATSEMTVSNQKKSVKIPLKHTIYHGPVMRTPDGLKYGSSYILTKLDMSKIPSKTKAILTTIFMDNEPFVQGVKTSFGTNIEITQTISPMYFDETHFSDTSKRSKDALSLRLEDGVHANFTTNLDYSALSGTLNMGKLTLTGNTDNNSSIEVTLSPSTSHFKMDEIYKGSMLIGEFEWHLPNFKFAQDSNEVLSTENLVIKTSSTIKNALFSGDSLLKTDTLMIHSPLVPETLSKTSVLFHSKAYDFNANVLKPAIDAMHAYIATDSVDFDNKNNNTDNHLVFIPDNKQLDLLLKDLVQTNSGVSQLIEINTDQGSFKLDFDLHYASQLPIKELTNNEELLKALKGSLIIKQDKNMLPDTMLEGLLAFPMIAPFITSSEKTLSSKITLENGKLTINEQESVSALDFFNLPQSQ